MTFDNLAQWVIYLEQTHPECDGVTASIEMIAGAKQLGGLINNNGQDYFFACGSLNGGISSGDLQKIDTSGTEGKESGHGLGLIYIPLITDIANLLFDALVKTLDVVGKGLGLPDLGKKFSDLWDKFIKWLNELLGKAIYFFWGIVIAFVLFLIYKIYIFFTKEII